jgi:hypothetical protein
MVASTPLSVIVVSPSSVRLRNAVSTRAMSCSPSPAATASSSTVRATSDAGTLSPARCARSRARPMSLRISDTGAATPAASGSRNACSLYPTYGAPAALPRSTS